MTELDFSQVAVGMMHLASWELSTQELVNWVGEAIRHGVTTFDHADIYGNYTCEALFGEALKAQPDLRDSMQIVTKCGIALLSDNRPAHTVKHYNTTTAHIVESAERSLRNLNTNYLDALLIHRPDPLMNVEEVVEAFERLKTAGKVGAFGVSNFTPYQFNLLQSYWDEPLVTNQVECSVMHRAPLHDGTFDHAQQHGYRPMVWSPLAGGSIFRDDAPRVKHTLEEIAARHEAGVDQIALAWLMMHPTSPVPVVGTGKIERLKAAFDAAELILSRQEWFTIWEAAAGHEVP